MPCENFFWFGGKDLELKRLKKYYLRSTFLQIQKKKKKGTRCYFKACWEENFHIGSDVISSCRVAAFVTQSVPVMQWLNGTHEGGKGYQTLKTVSLHILLYWFDAGDSCTHVKCSFRQAYSQRAYKADIAREQLKNKKRTARRGEYFWFRYMRQI